MARATWRTAWTAAIVTLAMTLGAMPARAGDELPRRVWLGVAFGGGEDRINPQPEDRVRVDSVVEGSTAAVAGIEPGDVVLAINDVRVSEWTDIARLVREARTGDAGFVTVSRAGNVLRLALTWQAIPLETTAGVTVKYGSLACPGGYRVRTILSMPGDTGGAVRGRPAFLWLQGLYCVSVDRPTAAGLPDTEVPRELAKAGFVVLRVEKPGVGDSEGPACSEIGFEEELGVYRAGLAWLRTQPEVDPDRVYVMGYSFGAIFAPMVAEGTPLAGIVTYGAHARTWMEYELENTRRQMTVLNESPAEIDERLRHVARFQSMLLLEKMTPGEIFTARPELRFEAPMLDDEHQYGRHARFFHELADRNVAMAWQKLQPANVLALHGEYDWVSSPEDSDLIVRIASTTPGGRGEFQSLDGLDHAMTRHGSLRESVQRFARGEWSATVSERVTNWVRRTEKKPARKPLPPPRE